ncbi:MAG TPA: two-component regulator propeller domain-containing protein, partial [Segetibacter sp.]|nr:two-component regulator propeller domain-containing protein [Segetibacter sp.]
MKPYDIRNVLIILFVIVPTITALSQLSNSFISINDGLVNNEVTSIIQDKNGFIWFGTRGGLQRYDGYEMKLLKNDIGDGNNLNSQSIEVLQNGFNDNIWIGTKSGGLSSYDFRTGTIINYNNKVKSTSGFNADYILSLLDTKGDKLFIGTWKGLEYFSKKAKSFTIISDTWKTFDILPDGTNGLWVATNSGLRHLNNNLINDKTYDFGHTGINITSIVHDSAFNCLWLGTWNHGLYCFNLKTHEIKNYVHKPADINSLDHNNTYNIFLDSKGSLWIGTWGGGLNRFNKASETFEKISLDIPGLFTSDNNIILNIMEDQSGLLWVCSDGAGVFKLDLNRKRFSNIVYDKTKKSLLGSTHVLAITVDKYNKLWLGTKGGGIQYSSDWKNFKQLDLKKFVPKNGSQKIEAARNFLEDRNTLWAVTNAGLLRIINEKENTGNIRLYTPDPADNSSIGGLKLTALVKDESGTIWIGTQEHGLSKINGYDSGNNPYFKNYFPAPGKAGALQNERVSCLLIDSKKRLWIGTYKGLHLYLPKTDNFECFMQTADLKHSISNNTILSLAEDKFGNIWAGTQFGLNKITADSNKDIFVHSYTTKDGLSSDYIHAVQADDDGRIWASTNRGLNRLNKAGNSFAVFDKRDGIQSMAFSENASFKAADGMLFFGGVEGATYFSPDSITINRFAPPVYFTNLKINNNLYEFGKNQPTNAVLKKPFYETQSIELTHEENIISIDFSALDYRAPDKNEYMYILQGFDKDWVHAGSRRTVSYTNLPPGTYYLRVKATNSDKIWTTNPHTLTITVLPPPWRTWWAYTIYVLLFLGLLWSTRYFGLKQASLKTQLKLSTVERRKEKELADFKEKLFVNISHEFRTPLTLILGPLDDLLQRVKLDKPVAKSLRQIQKQSKRMLRMVTQLLDYEKAQAGSLRLNPSPGEIVSFCYDIFLIFIEEADRRNITYEFLANQKFVSLTFDADKLEIIIFNLLSNAFKFTKDGGSVSFNINKENGFCKIVIQDSGVGIPADDIDRIFDRFYRGKQTDASNISGTGIGLSFVKELTELHGGEIHANSNGVNGSRFTLQLPAHKTAIEFDSYPDSFPFNANT